MNSNIFQFSPLLMIFRAEAGEVTEIVTRLLIQLAVILFAAKLAGEIATRYLKLPPVLAELGAGVVIGPFALGGIAISSFGPLFPVPEVDGVPAVIPVSNELFALAQLGSIFLLFAIGLETNLRQFLRYAGPATAVALGGVVLPFAFGAGATALLGFAEGFASPQALFMGAILTATSVGITARVLADLKQLDAPEGVTVLAAAVVDDVLGILVLTVVVGIGTAESFSLGTVGWIAFKAIAFWLGLTLVGILAAPYIERIISRFRSQGADLVLIVALAFLDLGRRVEEELVSINEVLVPVFFVVMGMLVDVGAMLNAVVFGLVISALAMVSKVFGSGLPALFSGFNLRGSARVGVGMMPRGEVALIIAGIGLSQGLIGPIFFGVSIMMTVITTLIAPIALIPLFSRGGSGVRQTRTPGELARRTSPDQLVDADDPPNEE